MAKGNFHACHTITAKWEGGWSDHDADPGGATMFGITIETLSTWRGRKVTKQEVKALTRSEAEKIYKAWYWDKVRGDDLPAGVDLIVYDFAVNSGPSRAVKFLQRIILVPQDGIIGPQTLAALRRAKPEHVIEVLCAERLKFLKGLSIWPTFGKGWGRRVADVEREALAMVVSHETPVRDPQPPLPSTGEPQGVDPSVLMPDHSVSWLGRLVTAILDAIIPSRRK